MYLKPFLTPGMKRFKNNINIFFGVLHRFFMTLVCTTYAFFISLVDLPFACFYLYGCTLIVQLF